MWIVKAFRPSDHAKFILLVFRLDVFAKGRRVGTRYRLHPLPSKKRTACRIRDYISRRGNGVHAYEKLIPPFPLVLFRFYEIKFEETCALVINMLRVTRESFSLSLTGEPEETL